MDSIGDFLYLILMVGAVIVSLLRKNKKEVPPMANPKPERDIKDLFPEMRNWMEDEEDEEVKDEEPVPVVATPKSTPFVPIESPVFTFDSPENYQQGRSTVKTAPMELESLDEDRESLFDDEPFDARKAILYSEIMKRPVW